MPWTAASRVIALAAMVSMLPLAALADRDPTDDERADIERVLEAEGFTSWEDIEFDEEGGQWEVDDAVGTDGEAYDLKLDRGFGITERKRDG